MISIIASIGRNLELGKNGGLAFTGRGELGYFRKTTMNHKIFMGHNTFVSLPRRLEGREYYVASAATDLPDWVNVVKDVDAFLKEWQGREEELFVIGGGMMYKTALPYAKKLHLTEINGTCPDADVFFPSFDKNLYTKTQVGEGEFDDGLTFVRFIYELI